MLKILLLTMILASPAFADYSESPGWVAGLKAAENTTQLAIVSGTHGSSARFSFHEKDSSGTWREIVSCPAYIGKKGWGKSREGDMKSPAGVYTFTEAFGILPDPGCEMGYLQVDGSHYWVGDSNSGRYNTMVSTREYDSFSRKDSEHITDYETAYKYCLNISYNESGTPGRGSAIFLHCQTKNHFTAGCVAIPEDDMREVLRHVKQGCVVVMDSHKKITKY
ncbi:MAG: L,D-transpeptidase family protein [Synergistaceae bacterium]|nr:L,D-transpeptidase family protein [Synergistaceae bacterium]